MSFKKCAHPDIEYSAGIEEEEEGEYIGPEPRVRSYTKEYCPDCGYGIIIYGDWRTK